MYQMNSELRSITSILIVEDLSKCPMGFTPISKTADSDKLDTDLWKDGWLTKKVRRYICFSKSQGRPEHVISAVQILHERDLPPEGFSLLTTTVDTNQRAFQKKQLCYKQAHYRTNVESIVDMIILSKPKPPDDYENIGEINGFYICVKKISAITRMSGSPSPYGLPAAPGMYPRLHDNTQDNSNTNSNGNTNYPYGSANFMDGDKSGPIYAPTQSPYSSGTLNALSGIDGVPFILHEALSPMGKSMSSRSLSSGLAFNLKTEDQLNREYSYDFRTEREVLMES